MESITRAKWCSNKVVGPEAIQKNLIHSSSWCCWGWNFGWSVASWTHKKNMSKKFRFWTFQNARGNFLIPSELWERIHWSWRKPKKNVLFFWIRVISRLTSFKSLLWYILMPFFYPQTVKNVFEMFLIEKQNVWLGLGQWSRTTQISIPRCF